MSADEDLAYLLAGRLDAARKLELQLCDPHYSSVQGVSKLRNRLASELKFLEGIASGKTRLEKKYIETSNVTHFENIISVSFQMAGLFQRNFSPPEVVFEFVGGVPDAIAAKLRSRGVIVIGEEVQL
ncbi:unnamed protein product [Angiostrongylus costaricensis]|uniref:DUF5614 domain-containing protein n=1 Tax=Angiostrongylus costaricensis TaxID=334426 RepID=A0A0R3Q140_ANGCS|nr:unnamed protein product [Angiostrongylus costaricensis]